MYGKSHNAFMICMTGQVWARKIFSHNNVSGCAIRATTITNCYIPHRNIQPDYWSSKPKVWHALQQWLLHIAFHLVKCTFREWGCSIHGPYNCYIEIENSAIKKHEMIDNMAWHAWSYNLVCVWWTLMLLYHILIVLRYTSYCGTFSWNCFRQPYTWFYNSNRW